MDTFLWHCSPRAIGNATDRCRTPAPGMLRGVQSKGRIAAALLPRRRRGYDPVAPHKR